ncbi:hypothetical protein [Pelagerythrobacter marinus]|uniref:hypothetical protein n=1 Tax=Pelagerythrobacter marinus TaxID=538382 RepID=UPI002036E4C3|nr:hypothetical protein [Pelagerythrobacter marinus]USA39325.1 hypothetical protein NCF86_13720 [Pelagerythrobacter marinus]WPZ06534.1 hypothetical protein T8T98_14130 [Pelagerythrobacter marinus]
MKRLALLIALFPLAACEPADNEPGPGGVTVGEARALDEAAAMLEERRRPVAAIAGDEPDAPASAPAAEPAGEDAPGDRETAEDGDRTPPQAEN